MTGKNLARRSDLVPLAEDWLHSCSLSLTAETQEKPVSIFHATPYVERELTGARSGKFDAVIGNCSLDPLHLLDRPSVFEWPGGCMYVALQVTQVDRFEGLTRIGGVVLGIVQYGPVRLDAAAARRQLLGE